MKDNINPNHYKGKGIECIEFTKHLDFISGNAFKYVFRHLEKNGLEDLNKAEWYLNRFKAELPEYPETPLSNADVSAILQTGQDLIPLIYKCEFQEPQGFTIQPILSYIVTAAVLHKAFRGTQNNLVIKLVDGALELLIARRAIMYGVEDEGKDGTESETDSDLGETAGFIQLMRALTRSLTLGGK